MRTAAGWQPQTARMITARYLARTSSLPRAILAESDSLLLTPMQSRALRVTDSTFTAEVRAIYGALGEALARPERGTPGASEVALATTATTSYERVFWAQVDIAVAILTPVQRALMPLVQTLASQPASARPGSRWTFGFAVPLEDPR